jgi:hypothetical protein
MPAVESQTASLAQLRGNASFQWDEFDPEWYVDHNYRHVREDDRRILQLVRDFFVNELDRPVAKGIDVGSGPNLYPTLAMLPFCRNITLLERGRSNFVWLNREIRGYSRSWDAFWDVVAHKPDYRCVDDPRRALRQKTRAHRGDLFKLGRRQSDVGTMFFVAESITNEWGEFRQAVDRFIRALKPDAPFAAAFMKNSTGYTVGTQRFPAMQVNEVDIKQCLSDLECGIHKLETIPSVTPLREGYDGMILALGRAGNPRN